MTVETTTIFSGPYTGTGAANQEFSVTFQSASESEIAVLLDGAEVDSSSYTFDRESDGTGTVTATLDGEVYIFSAPNFQQAAEFQRQGPIFPDDFNAPLDAAAIRDLWLKARVDALFPAAGLIAADRAGYFAGWGAGGEPVLLSGTGADGALRTDLASAGGAALVGEASGGSMQDALDAMGYAGALDTPAALQAAFDYVGIHGGELRLPSGASYAMTTQLTLTPSTFRNIHIVGYGVEITTTGAISGLLVAEAFSVPGQIVIEGIKVNHRGNAAAAAGFEASHAANVTWRNCQVEAHGVNADYGGFWLHQSDPEDQGTACNTCNIEDCTVRPKGDVAGSIPYGVKLQGASNDTTICGLKVTADVGIYLYPEAGTDKAISNSVTITRMNIEAFTDAVLVDAAATEPATGLRVYANRAENGTNFINLQGATTQPRTPLVHALNWVAQNVTTYLNNPNDLHTFGLDIQDVRGPQTDIGGLWRIRNIAGAGHTLDVWSSAEGQVIQQWNDFEGNLLAALTDLTNDIPGLVELAGNNGGMLLTGIGGISQTTTKARNLRGTATFGAATTVGVVFPVEEADGNYYIQLTPKADPVGRLWVSGEDENGFIINNSSATSIAVNWHLTR